MLGVLAALAVLSALILVGIVFRPTAADDTRRSEGIVRREGDAFAVLGAFPSAEAREGYDQLLADARAAGVTLDWDRARRENATSTDGGPTLVSSARNQLAVPTG